MMDFLVHCLAWRLPAFMIKVFVYVAVVAAIAVLFNCQTLQDYFQARQRHDAYQESVAHLRQECQDLRQERAMLEQGGFEWERAARERWMMIKPGEHVLFVETEAEAARHANVDSTPDRDALPPVVPQSVQAYKNSSLANAFVASSSVTRPSLKHSNR
jgi:cell division protein FtsB